MSGDTSSRKSEKSKEFVVPVYTFCNIFAHVKINNGKVSIIKNYPIELTEKTANVNDIKSIISKKLNFPNPVVILNRNFEKIENNLVTRGELFWNRGFKYYFADEKEWETNLTGENKRVKSVTYPVKADTSKIRSKSAYWPVTLPRTFRRSLTRLKILRNHIFVCKYLPFELSEYIANVYDIKTIIKEKYGFEDPIILDQRYLEVLDDPWTRGEKYWHTNQNFYFLERSEWDEYVRKKITNKSSSMECSSSSSKRFEYVTYFNRKRSTYYKSKEF